VSLKDPAWGFFMDELLQQGLLLKEAANSLSDGIKVPGMANSGIPKGLVNPTRAGGQNLAKFQLAGPGKTPMTGGTKSVVASQSLSTSGQTGSLSLPAPMTTPRGPK